MFYKLKRLFQKATPGERALRSTAEGEWDNQHKSIIWACVSLIVFLVLMSATVYCVMQESHSHDGTMTFTADDGRKWTEEYHNFSYGNVPRGGEVYIDGSKVSIDKNESSSLIWNVLMYVFMFASLVSFIGDECWNNSKKNKFIRQYVKSHTVEIKDRGV